MLLIGYFIRRIDPTTLECVLILPVHSQNNRLTLPIMGKRTKLILATVIDLTSIKQGIVERQVHGKYFNNFSI